jgi:hypothetical protein
MDGSLAIFHGPRKLANYDSLGKLKEGKRQPDRVTNKYD